MLTYITTFGGSHSARNVGAAELRRGGRLVELRHPHPRDAHRLRAFRSFCPFFPLINVLVTRTTAHALALALALAHTAAFLQQ